MKQSIRCQKGTSAGKKVIFCCSSEDEESLSTSVSVIRCRRRRHWCAADIDGAVDFGRGRLMLTDSEMEWRGAGNEGKSSKIPDRIISDVLREGREGKWLNVWKVVCHVTRSVTADLHCTYPITLKSRWGTTDHLSTSFFHLSLFHCFKSPLLDVIVPSFILSPSLPSAWPSALQDGFCKTWWSGDVTVPPHFKFLFFGVVVSRSSWWPMAWSIICRTSLFVVCCAYQMPRSRLCYLISMLCILFCSSAVRFHDSHTYRKLEIRNKCSILTFDPRGMLLPRHRCLSPVKAAFVYAVLARSSWWNLYQTRLPQDIWSICPFTLMSEMMPELLWVG